jgi:hypothetical protein
MSKTSSENSQQQQQKLTAVVWGILQTADSYSTGERYAPFTELEV